MESLKLVVLELVDGNRQYGYLFQKDYESENNQYCRFVEHGKIKEYREMNNVNIIIKIDKSDIIFIDNNLRF